MNGSRRSTARRSTRTCSNPNSSATRRAPFTGAVGEKKGLFEIADKGTLFLDEIGELNVGMQAKLLRALQEKEILRVGGTRAIKIDVRVLAATNRDLEAMVRDGRFREDLYYRLNVIPIHIPPLRSRRDDLAQLMDHFLRKHAANAPRPMQISAEARRMMMEYGWPGNVRQLESAIERGASARRGRPDHHRGSAGRDSSVGSRRGICRIPAPSGGISFEDLERSLILQAMEQTGWNITRSARSPWTLIS
jgi:transcriptional regulator with GAF, ATPase, and Fis domain